MQEATQKLHRFFLYAFVFFLPWQTVLIFREIFYGDEKWQYGTIGIYFSDIFLLLWICLSIYIYHKEIYAWIAQNITIVIALLLFEFWIIASILWSDDRINAAYHAIIVTCVIDMIALLHIIPFSIRKITLIFIISTCGQALLGIYQFLTQSSFFSTVLGTSSHIVTWGGTATITTAGERWLRAYGGMTHPNILGGLLLTAALLTFTLYVTVNRHTHKNNFFFLCTFIVTISGIFTTFSRTAWVVAILSFFFLAIWHFTTVQNMTKKIITPAITIFFTIVLWTFFFSNIAFPRAIHDTFIEHNSIDDRVLYVIQAKKIIQSNFLTGTGIGNYTNTTHTFFDPAAPIWFFQPVHNIFVLIFAEIGFVGITLFFMLWIIFGMQFLKKRIPTTPLQRTYFVIFCCIIVIGMIDHWPWSSHFGIVFWGLITGIMIHDKQTISSHKVKIISS